MVLTFFYYIGSLYLIIFLIFFYSSSRVNAPLRLLLHVPSEIESFGFVTFFTSFFLFNGYIYIYIYIWITWWFSIHAMIIEDLHCIEELMYALWDYSYTSLAWWSLSCITFLTDFFLFGGAVVLGFSWWFFIHYMGTKDLTRIEDCLSKVKIFI